MRWDWPVERSQQSRERASGSAAPSEPRAWLSPDDTLETPSTVLEHLLHPHTRRRKNRMCQGSHLIATGFYPTRLSQLPLVARVFVLRVKRVFHAAAVLGGSATFYPRDPRQRLVVGLHFPQTSIQC